MNIQSEIDDTLRRLGSVEPPSGLAGRVNLRLQNPRPRFSFSIMNTRTIAACGLAASVGLSAVALNPGLRNMVLHHTSARSTPPANTLRVVPPAGGFGTASSMHVPAEPVPVQPSPVNQGRGRSRSGRAVLPNGSQTPLPRGVVATTAPLR
jgi:hypothetical protein